MTNYEGRSAELDNLITSLTDIVISKIQYEEGKLRQEHYEEVKRTFKTYFDIYIKNRIQDILNNQNIQARLESQHKKYNQVFEKEKEDNKEFFAMD